ncbi:Ig-like domain-containing protein [Phytoactinopolyspora halotolerans]|nr:Ig-like domain-containing protein [Phytoactinopolyspora halotolerans]
MMQAIYDAEKDGTDFWMDRLLARAGDDPAGNQWLMTRGRALLMRTHQPGVIGFGGQMAYYDPYFDRLSGEDGYTVTIGDGDFSEQVDQRRQTPSHWHSVHASDAQNLTADVHKFITHNNVAVANIAITNDADTVQTVPIAVDSPFVWTPDGDELTGVLDVMNSRREPLTTIFPRLSGTGLSPDDSRSPDDSPTDGEGRLTGEVTLEPGETTTVKVQLGVVADEIAESESEYEQYRDLSPDEAFATHVQAYNTWWADNVPYIDVPDEAIEKYIYYRWWLMRFNYVDADIPGNDFQFPTSIEGVLGYNNAIALTVPMFVDELKYLRDPAYSYGPWVSTGESSQGGRFRDNPGDPENWSNSYTQYISEAALRSYQIHGGPSAVVENLARYAEGDVRGQLDTYDTDDNWLIEYDWGAMTGNDADAVSFHWRNGNLDRAESAYQYSGALAAAEAYAMLGDDAKAAEMRAIADNIGQAFLDVLWNPERQLFEHVHVASGDHVPWKEINNYYPFSVGAIPNEEPYIDALRLFDDPEEYPLFPFFTANQRDKAEAAEQGEPGSNNFSQINSTVQFRLFSSVLRNYDQDYITAEDYKKLLYWNAWAGYIGGNTAWPDSNEFWANWNPDTQQIDYRSWIHHTILGSSNWTVIEDAMGLRPRSDTKIELSPIDVDWDHFTVNHLRYRDADLTIVWDDPSDGESHYPGVPEGYSAYVNGERAFTVDSLTAAVWNPETGEVELPGGDGEILYAAAMPGLSAPQDVQFDADDRVVDVMAKAGADVTGTGDAANLAEGADVTASFSEDGFGPAGAVDGATINLPYWSTRGSSEDQDWYELDFGEPTTFDDVRLYFYRDRVAPGGQGGTALREPSSYQIQYHDGDSWFTVADQAKTPAIPRANYNRVRFPEVTSDRMRVLLNHQSGHRTGLKEAMVFGTGVQPPTPENMAPYVLAREDHSFQQGSQARLIGTVKDDGLPVDGTLSSSWAKADGPGTVIFDDASSARIVATFTEPGTYTLELTADDGELSESSSVTVHVSAAGDQVNVAADADVSCSYTSPWESCAAVNDGIDPPQSNDSSNPRWGTWPETGEHWVELTWDDPVRVDASDMYFFADVPAGGSGGVQTPASWAMQYWTGDEWVDVPGASGYEVAADQYNSTTFDTVSTTRLRATLQSRPEAGGVGVLEWKVYAEAPESIRELHVPTLEGHVPDFPETVTAVHRDGSRAELPVVWPPIEPEQVATGGTSFEVTGVVQGAALPATATVYVRFTDAVEITSLAEEEVMTLAGVAPQLPPTVTATFNDGSRDNVSTTVNWEDVDPGQYAEPGTFTVTGQVAGTSIQATATVVVLDGTPPEDACPDGYSPDETVTFGTDSVQDSGVPNRDRGDGCTFLDVVWAEAPFESHGQFVRVVDGVAAEWREAGHYTAREIRDIRIAAARSDVD